ncbi:MAG: replication-associated recombination protein A [Proteobacteria bacterium]|nr:replication-associated recombination protein A [Pseudomonadota bacterium]
MSREPYRPLADRMRPRSLAEFTGQAHLLAPGKPLRRLVEGQTLHSMLLWGPPGTGKTTLARLVAQSAHAEFHALSAVLAGVKDIREVVERAKAARAAQGTPTVLFLDEVHRFNRAQQDTFLPFVEDGTLVFVGATTENPSFEVNSALLSRARTYVLKPLGAADLEGLIDRALADAERGLGASGVGIEPAARALLGRAADGDARRVLNFLEVAADLATPVDGRPTITEAIAAEVAAGGHRRFDKRGEQFYDQMSVLHKAVRGSDPDAALYWLCRMLDGGCDPLYVARRAIRMASEDVGNADPRALALALEATEAYERLGSPEGELAIAQAIVYLAVAPKSNAVYTAFGAAREDAQALGTLDVPLAVRNAPTRLMKELGYGQGYRYDHDEPGAHAAGQRYFPDGMAPKTYYDPVPRGLEIKIREALARRRGGG